ncbi:MAG: LytTR family DNA-binding domain-containing protein, partial [Bacteroidota bacterium]
DIQLGDGSAFDFLGSVTVTSSIIFTTAYDEYAIKAFKYNSIDYLLKPIEKRALIDALNKFMALSVKNIGKKGHQLQTVRKIITNEYQKRFLIKIGEQYKNLLMEDINFFYSRAGQCYIHTGSAQHLPIDHSLDHLVDKVNPLDFFRVNRQYLIKSTSIVEIHTYFNSRLLLKLSPDNTEVIVSRDRVNDFKRWLDS